MIYKNKRTATVVSMDYITLAKIDQKQFLELTEQIPSLK